LLSGTDIVVSGNGGDCDRPEITIPATVVPGEYRLDLDAYVERGDESRLSDGVSVPVSVIQHAPAGAAR
jgi:hypothetical protein